MNEREFRELLNLYLDREITSANADRLEREVRSNAGRHRTYLQYCRMQQGVRRLGSAEDVLEKERSPASPASKPGVIREWSGYYRWVATGAVAVAAVLVFALAFRRVESARTTAEDRLAAGRVRPDATVQGPAPTLGLSGDALLLSTFLATGPAPKVHEDQFNWVRQFQLVSLESRLGAQPLSPAVMIPQTAAPAAFLRPLGEDATEMAAFKFVK